jgi:hypothetical protein
MHYACFLLVIYCAVLLIYPHYDVGNEHYCGHCAVPKVHLMCLGVGSTPICGWFVIIMTYVFITFLSSILIAKTGVQSCVL